LAAARAAGEDLDARYIIDRVHAGDEEAIEVFAIVGRHLGVGITNLVNIFNPEVVVIGGGVAAAGEALLAPARKEYECRVLKATAGARIVAAELGNDAGVLGAAALVL
jgi:glucokinase